MPRAILPEVRNSSEIYGMTDPSLFGAAIPVASSIGDQQGALFGQSCFTPGMVKATYGTGGSLMMNAGDKPMPSQNGLLTTVAWQIDGKIDMRLKGCCSPWARSCNGCGDELRMIHSAARRKPLPMRFPTPMAFISCRPSRAFPRRGGTSTRGGTIVGLTRGANRNHLIRAALESMAYQIRDVIGCMEADAKISVSDLKVDGGAAANNFVHAVQADQLGVNVLRPKVADTTARVPPSWRDLRSVTGGQGRSQGMPLPSTGPSPRRLTPDAERLYKGWSRAVDRARELAEHE